MPDSLTRHVTLLKRALAGILLTLRRESLIGASR